MEDIIKNGKLLKSKVIQKSRDELICWVDDTPWFDELFKKYSEDKKSYTTTYNFHRFIVAMSKYLWQDQIYYFNKGVEEGKKQLKKCNYCNKKRFSFGLCHICETKNILDLVQEIKKDYLRIHKNSKNERDNKAFVRILDNITNDYKPFLNPINKNGRTEKI